MDIKADPIEQYNVDEDGTCLSNNFAFPVENLRFSLLIEGQLIAHSYNNEGEFVPVHTFQVPPQLLISGTIVTGDIETNYDYTNNYNRSDVDWDFEWDGSWFDCPCNVSLSYDQPRGKNDTTNTTAVVEKIIRTTDPLDYFPYYYATNLLQSYSAFYNKVVNRRNNDDGIPLKTKLIPVLYNEWIDFMALDEDFQLDNALMNVTHEFFFDLADIIKIDYICFKNEGEANLDFFLRMSGYTFIVQLVLIWIQAIYKLLKTAKAVDL